MTITREDLDAGRIAFTDPDIDVAGPRLPPVHPGEILRDEFMQPLGITAYRLSHQIAVPANRISELLHGRRSITADTALRLQPVLGTSPEFWMNLQTAFDLEVARNRMTGKSFATNSTPR
jgi:addiction module HigA family antidote